MVRMQLAVVAAALVLCCSNVEARGRRYTTQQAYTPYYTTTPTYTTTPVYSTVQAANVGVPTGTVTTTVGVATPSVVPANGIIQTNGASPTGTVVTANSVAPATSVSTGTVVPTANAAAPGSAQWKAEQSARMGSVAHIGGGFGGGSYEGNGFGATPDQAIQNACFWGQKTPIQIGVARGANGYYATIFYR